MQARRTRIAAGAAWVVLAAGCKDQISEPRDTTPPSTITDLRGTSPGLTSITLLWTAPGDDGNQGRAKRYEVRSMNGPIGNDTWNSANLLSSALDAPRQAGAAETLLVSNLLAGQTYYFALRACDESSNWSQVSNSPSLGTLDIVPPSAVTDLVAGSPTDSAVTLTWTAPGDDGDVGQAIEYDLRYSESPISDSNWDAATLASRQAGPLSAGLAEENAVRGLGPFAIYYFAIKTRDDAFNWSPLSNGTMTTTTGLIRILGNRVVWSTGRASRCSIRYGFAPGIWDHMAYPNAAGRIDRAYLSGEHSVTLFDLRPGQRVYCQAVNEAVAAATILSPINSFIADTGPSDNLLVATMINIGFGDSHIIHMPTTGKRLVIDCGYRDAESAVETYYHDHDVTSIDAMLATHVHEDHLGGIVGSFSSDRDGVVARFPPQVFFDSPVKSSRSLGKAAYGELLRSLPAGTTRVLLDRGDSSDGVAALQLDPQVRILCLNSGTRPGYVDVPSDYEGTVINNESIVLRFSYGDVDFIIGGDCENETEASILADARFPASTLEVEYFKAAHHGLPDANGAGWVNTLRPRVAFIPNTRRVWDPPSEFEGAISSTVRNLHGVGADIYVIDEASSLDRPRGSTQYNVSFVTDGHSYEVRVEVATQPAPAKPAQAFGCFQ